ncbi:DUF927 domain-containing protein [Brevibacillus invocatus]|uniref:phage NrS-1 polymerase family protein n=1 Tax=Brevibacillus invocatus TaxID=173959 RepID=UPI0020405695|nr:DUF927 domain-containing protein [Brevibacillus invocatus]MCM3079582.1 DUF927 domain-containing protein [Brevibacillus invocatus]MCM3429780.1 DUF927 domain-containing protein [Brevibacillus invocatus]
MLEHNEKAAFAGGEGQLTAQYSERVSPIITQTNQSQSRNNEKKYSFHSIPDELKSCRQWVLWKLEERNNGPTKVPYCQNGEHAKSSDPSTWSDFGEVVAVYERGGYDGIGFMFSKQDPFIGIDIDKCVSNGTLSPLAQDITELVNSYTEWSPSGKGIHIIARGQLNIQGTGKKKPELGLEIYHRGRYFTFTGQSWNSRTVIEDCQHEINELMARYFSNDKVSTNSSEGKFDERISDDQLWNYMFSSKAGEEIRSLYEGNISAHNNDHSSADMALCCYLAWFTKHDRERIDRMFRQSKLYRPKWDELRGEQKYGQITIQKAIETTVLHPSLEEQLAAAKELVDIALEQAAAGDKKAVLSERIISALAVVREYDALEFGRIEIELKERKLFSIVNRVLKQHKPQGRVAEQDEQVQSNDNPLKEWETDENGFLYRKKWTEQGIQKVLVTRTAPTIKRVLIADQSSHEYWEIEFKTVRGRAVTVQVSRESISTKRGVIAELSKYGFDIGEDNARDVSKYLRDYAAAHVGQTEEQKFMERFGWTKDYKSFVIGNDVLGEQNIEFKAPGAGEQQLAEAFTVRGALESWKKIIPLVSEKEWVMFKIYQSFLPPLLPILEIKGHVLSNYGESSKGKTLTDMVAASVWGNANYKSANESLMIQGAGITLDKMEKTLSLMTHIPTFVQDAHKIHEKVITDTLHAVELGNAKGRGSNNNGSQANRRIQTILYVTSEAPLTSTSKDGGIVARLVECEGSPLREENTLLVYEIEEVIYENYGHAGRQFVQYLLDNRDKWDEWRQMFHEAKKDAAMETEGLDTKVTRTNPFYVAVAMAGILADRALELGLGEEKIMGDVRTCLEEARGTMNTAPYYEKALDVLRDWIQANRSEFYIVFSDKTGSDISQTFSKNIPGVWQEIDKYVAMFPSRIDEVLKQHDFDLARCVKGWKDKGYLNLAKDGKPQRNTWYPVTKTSPRMYQFTYEALRFK